MRLLLDTHIFLWWLSDDPNLPARAREVISDGNNTIYISAACVWEIWIKKALGKLAAPENIEAIVEEEGFHKLSISLKHAETAGRLPPHHRDPFDRMLIAQAVCEDMLLVTADKNIAAYPVEILKLESSP